jgi:uncharacterized protein (DUF2062 family)
MIQTFLEAWYRLLYEDATPNRIALGFAVGLFTSFFPAPVLDTLAALAIAFVVRGNRAACLVGNNLGLMLFPVIPFVLGTEYLIGRLILRLPAVTPPAHWTLWAFLKSQEGTYYSLVIGSLVLAVPSAIIGFFVVRSATTYYQASKRRKENLPQGAVSDAP